MPTYSFMALQEKGITMTPEQLKSKCIMFRNELERQGASLGIMMVFDSMCAYLGEESRGLNKAERQLEDAQQQVKKYKALAESNGRAIDARVADELAQAHKTINILRAKITVIEHDNDMLESIVNSTTEGSTS